MASARAGYIVALPNVPHPSELVVRTRRRFSSAPGRVWPLLCNSQMAGATSPLFRLGVPQPIECRLPRGPGGVGAERECVSDQGVVHQRILEWSPESHLSFRMEETSLPFRSHIHEMVDTIDLIPTQAGVEVTRTTAIRVKGRFQLFRKVMLFLGVKQVHRFVFQNWLQLAAS